MDLQHFGDSYDIVKKSLLQLLGGFGPWLAHPMFTHPVSESDAAAFSRFLGIPLGSTETLVSNTDRRSYLAACGNCRSLFLDPDTGIRLNQLSGKRSPHFLFADELVELANQRPAGLILTFDQSLARGREKEQIQTKLGHLKGNGIAGFAYVSHASFMILERSQQVVKQAEAELAAKSGLPPSRLIRNAS